MRRTDGRWLGIATVVLVGATMLVGTTAAPAAAAATPTIAVYPTTPLADGQRVLVIGNGFDPAARVSAQECIDENYECVDVPFSGSVRADGLLVGATTVERALPYDGAPNDCAVYHCGLMVSQPTVGSAFTWLHFAPGTVTVTPSTNVREGQPVTVVGTNLIPGQQVGLAECQDYGNLCTRRLDAAGSTVVGPDGTVRLRTVPSRFIPDYMERDDLYDCAVDTCRIAINLESHVWEDGYESVALTPVRYAPTPAIGANPAGAFEGNAGAVPMTVTFTSAVGASAPRVVQYRTLPRSASAGSDYVPATGTVVLPAGVTRGQVTVAVRGDVTAEPDETFFVELRGIGPVRTRPTLVPVTIFNDDLGLTGALTGRYTADLDHSGTHTAGDEVTWTATVTNTGTTPTARNVELTVWLCSAIRGVVPPVWTASSWTTTRGSTSTVTGPDDCPGIEATIGTLPPGASATVTVTSALVQVPPLTVPAAIAHADFSGSNAGRGSVPNGIPGAVIVN
jgi:hypothetical protein